MKRLIYILIALALPLASWASNTPPPMSPPHFEPPKNMSGPVFPPEELIGEPGPETDRFLSEVVSMVATLGLLIALILIVGWFLKRLVNTRMEQANTTSGIKVLERRTLSPKSAIYLLDVRGQGVIIAETPHGVTRLSDFPIEPEKPESSDRPASPFDKVLDR